MSFTEIETRLALAQYASQECKCGTVASGPAMVTTFGLRRCLTRASPLGYDVRPQPQCRACRAKAARVSAAKARSRLGGAK